MSSIFYRLDELERVQQEILDILHGENTEIPESDENARIATHSHEMHPRVTNKDTLVERVSKLVLHSINECNGYEHWRGSDHWGRTIILEIADALVEQADVIHTPGMSHYWIPVDWLRSQVEP